MLRVACLAGAIVLGSAVVVSPAHAAKDCRYLVSATSRSTAKVSDQ